MNSGILMLMCARVRTPCTKPGSPSRGSLYTPQLNSVIRSFDQGPCDLLGPNGHAPGHLVAQAADVGVRGVALRGLCRCQEVPKRAGQVGLVGSPTTPVDTTPPFGALLITLIIRMK